MSEGLKTFAAQVSAGSYVSDIFYILGCFGVLLGMVALTLLDAGIVDKKNVVDTIVQKWICGLVGGVAYLLVGYGMWNWQIYQALGVPHALAQALSDWSLFGPDLTTYAQHIDPSILPGADTAQIFGAFFILFIMLSCMLMHGAGVERMKPMPAYIMSLLIGGMINPVMAYLTYSSASPLTNKGLHDFVGDFVLYVFIGVWGLILAWRLGPRRNVNRAPGNFPLQALGAFFLMLAIPLFVPACGFLIPGEGFYGIAANDSGLGLTFYGLTLAMVSGGISGSIVAYIRGNPIYVLLGPIAGYISCSALIDLALPWQAFIIAFFGPVVMALSDTLMRRLGIDETKIVPLALGPGLFSAIMAGVVGAGRAQGGFFGVTSGVYALQHARISIVTQLQGVVLMVAGSALVGFLVILMLEKTIGLRVTAAQEDQGLDATYWSRFTEHSAPLNRPDVAAAPSVR
jgi:ammonium transporter, Amt family